MRSNPWAISALFAGVCFAATTVWAQHGAHKIITPNDLKWEDVAALPPEQKSRSSKAR
jgi:hypothetical protein